MIKEIRIIKVIIQNGNVFHIIIISNTLPKSSPVSEVYLYFKPILEIGNSFNNIIPF